MFVKARDLQIGDVYLTEVNGLSVLVTIHGIKTVKSGKNPVLRIAYTHENGLGFDNMYANAELYIYLEDNHQDDNAADDSDN